MTSQLKAPQREYNAALRERTTKRLADLEREIRGWLEATDERLSDVEGVVDTLRLARGRIKEVAREND